MYIDTYLTLLGTYLLGVGRYVQRTREMSDTFLGRQPFFFFFWLLLQISCETRTRE